MLQLRTSSRAIDRRQRGDLRTRGGAGARRSGAERAGAGRPRNAAEAGADQAGDTDEPVKPVPCLFYYGNRCLAMPQAMRSFRGDGAAVSTTADQIRFLRSLFLEGLLRPETLERMQQWNRIFFPFRYGMGLMQFQLPAILTGFRRMPEFIGHSGASGAINFYCPERRVFVAGTFNQLKDRSLPFQWMARAVGLL